MRALRTLLRAQFFATAGGQSHVDKLSASRWKKGSLQMARKQVASSKL